MANPEPKKKDEMKRRRSQSSTKPTIFIMLVLAGIVYALFHFGIIK